MEQPVPRLFRWRTRQGDDAQALIGLHISVLTGGEGVNIPVRIEPWPGLRHPSTIGGTRTRISSPRRSGGRQAAAPSVWMSKGATAPG
jgi:hypothetical protein